MTTKDNNFFFMKKTNMIFKNFKVFISFSYNLVQVISYENKNLNFLRPESINEMSCCKIETNSLNEILKAQLEEEKRKSELVIMFLLLF